jgi:hypothetical protein
VEFLRGKFHEELTATVDDEGYVEIGGYQFSPNIILKEMEPVGYDEVFIEWLDLRKTRLLEKADKILKTHTNKQRFKSLKHAYERSAVVPFVGAGMSMPSGYPGWTKFLWQLREETRITEKELNDLLGSGKYEEAAQRLADDMPANCFNEALENTFGHDEPLEGPIQLLPLIFSPCAITTNFDDVLKKCYENAKKPFREIILGADSSELPRLLGNKDDVLVKLHGKASSGKGRILTFREYQDNYGIDASLGTRIHDICKYTLLFLGCSLSFDRTLEAMRDLVSSKGHENVVRHYAFLSLKQGEDRLVRRDELASANIFPIWYPESEDHNECIEALLLKLAEGIVEL